MMASASFVLRRMAKGALGWDLETNWGIHRRITKEQPRGLALGAGFTRAMKCGN